MLSPLPPLLVLLLSLLFLQLRNPLVLLQLLPPIGVMEKFRRDTWMNLTEFLHPETAHRRRQRVCSEIHKAHRRINNRCEMLQKAYIINNFLKDKLLQGQYIADCLGREYADRNRRMARNAVHISDNIEEMLEQAISGSSPQLRRDQLCFKSTICALLRAARWRLPDGSSPDFARQYKAMVQDTICRTRQNLLAEYGKRKGTNIATPLVVTYTRNNTRRYFKSIKRRIRLLPPGVRPEKIRNPIYEDDWQKVFGNVAVVLRDIADKEHHPHVARLPPWKRKWKIMDLKRKLQLKVQEEKRQRANHNKRKLRDDLNHQAADWFPAGDQSVFSDTSPPQPAFLEQLLGPEFSPLDHSQSHCRGDTVKHLNKGGVEERKLPASLENNEGDADSKKLSSEDFFDDLYELQDDDYTNNRLEEWADICGTDMSENAKRCELPELLLHFVKNPFFLDVNSHVNGLIPEDFVPNFEGQEINQKNQLLKTPISFKDSERLITEGKDGFLSSDFDVNETGEGRSEECSKMNTSSRSSTHSEKQLFNEKDVDVNLNALSFEPSSVFSALFPFSSSKLRPEYTPSIFHSRPDRSIDGRDTASTVSLTDTLCSVLGRQSHSLHSVTTQSSLTDLGKTDSFQTGYDANTNSVSGQSLQTYTAQTSENGFPQQFELDNINDKTQSAYSDCSVNVQPCVMENVNFSCECSPVSKSVRNRGAQNRDRTRSCHTVKSAKEQDATAAGEIIQTLTALASDSKDASNVTDKSDTTCSPVSSNVNQSSLGYVTDDEYSAISDSDIVNLVRTANQLTVDDSVESSGGLQNPELATTDAARDLKSSEEDCVQTEDSKTRIQKLVQVFVQNICKNILVLILESLPKHLSDYHQEKTSSQQQTQTIKKCTTRCNKHRNVNTKERMLTKYKTAEKATGSKNKTCNAVVGGSTHRKTQKLPGQNLFSTKVCPSQNQRHVDCMIEHIVNNAYADPKDDNRRKNKKLLITDKQQTNTHYLKQDGTSEQYFTADFSAELNSAEPVASATFYQRNDKLGPKRTQSVQAQNNSISSVPTARERDKACDAVRPKVNTAAYGGRVSRKCCTENTITKHKNETSMMSRHERTLTKPEKAVKPTSSDRTHDDIVSHKNTDSESTPSTCTPSRSSASRKRVPIVRKSITQSQSNQNNQTFRSSKGTVDVSKSRKSSHKNLLTDHQHVPSVKSLSSCHVGSSVRPPPVPARGVSSEMAPRAVCTAGRRKSGPSKMKSSVKRVRRARGCSSVARNVTDKASMSQLKPPSQNTSQKSEHRPGPTRFKSTANFSNKVAGDANNSIKTDPLIAGVPRKADCASKPVLKNSKVESLNSISSKCIIEMKGIKEISASLLLMAISEAVYEILEVFRNYSCDYKSSIADLLTAARLVTRDPMVIASLLSLVTEPLASHLLKSGYLDKNDQYHNRCSS